MNPEQSIIVNRNIPNPRLIHDATQLINNHGISFRKVE